MNEIEERIRAAVRPYKASDALAPTPNERGGPAPRRRRLRLAGLVVAVMLASGTAVASTTSFFTTAPDWVRGILSTVPEVDEANAIKVGVIDDHGTFAAPRGRRRLLPLLRPRYPERAPLRGAMRGRRPRRQRRPFDLGDGGRWRIRGWSRARRRSDIGRRNVARTCAADHDARPRPRVLRR